MAISKKRSVAGVARTAKREENKLVNTVDSFQNFSASLGMGTNNTMAGSTYGFNPITRQRVQLEWIHRGSWLGGVAVDVVADDMTRAGVELLGSIKPDDIETINEAITTLGVWTSIAENTQWSRLYGGSIAVILIEGHDLKTKLRVETVGKGMFKGLCVLDRWMLDPSLEDLVTDLGPDLGMPKYYRVTGNAPALAGEKIHYSRVIRQVGIKLPYWQRLVENLWGLSVIERLYDRMVAFDSATMGAAQLVYKAYMRTWKVDSMREAVAAGGPALAGLVASVEFMRKYQGIEGISLIDAKDDWVEGGATGFTGLSDALTQFGQQLAGALQIPLVRLFGQSPSGFSTGDTDLRMYYDSINQQQNRDLKVGITRVYRCVAQSEGIILPDGFGIKFKSLWQLEEKEKAEIAASVVSTIVSAVDAGLLSDQGGMKELKQSSGITGIFTNISEQDISQANETPAPEAKESTPEELAEFGEKIPGEPKKQAKDSHSAISHFKLVHDLDIVIEQPKGAQRQGGFGDNAWQVFMPADYGYIQGTVGADGEGVDCYLGDSKSPTVWVIDSMCPVTDRFDEHKCMIGFGSYADAVATFVKGYGDGKGINRVQDITKMDMDLFREWLKSGDLKQPARSWL